MLFLGIDTSCYTTSLAGVSENDIVFDERIVLQVKSGERGLRQSEAVFQHVRNMQTLIDSVSLDCGVEAVGVSKYPRPAEESYMPVFVVGQTVATALSAAASAKLFYTSHQQGHIRAALVGNERLLGGEFVAMHLSGGTTELLLVGRRGEIELIGGCSDLHAGQLVDRVGVLLKCPFPCGKHMETLAVKAGKGAISIPSCVRGLECSLSGAETKIQREYIGKDSGEIAYSVYDLLARTFSKLMLNAADATGKNRFLLAGGVASSLLLRQMLNERLRKKGLEVFYSRPELASDNAVGAALLCRDAMRHEGWYA